MSLLTVSILLFLFAPSEQDGPHGSISGFVTDFETKASIPNAQIALIPTRLKTETNSDGWFLLNRVPTGTWDL